MEQRAALPDILDVVVAGGGPGGTAAAMRAVELGLSVQVIEADDLLREIRDFGPTKIVEPDYGPRADTNPFPPGGPLVTALHFETMAAGDMQARWRGAYRQHNIAARIGVEFTGLKRTNDGVWVVKGWSHRARQDVSLRARNVVLAVGGSVRRRYAASTCYRQGVPRPVIVRRATVATPAPASWPAPRCTAAPVRPAR